MCGCISRIENGLKEKLCAEHVTIDTEILSGKTYTVVDYSMPGVKKHKATNVFHTYCPWCGEKYAKDGEA